MLDSFAMQVDMVGMVDMVDMVNMVDMVDMVDLVDMVGLVDMVIAVKMHLVIVDFTSFILAVDWLAFSSTFYNRMHIQGGFFNFSPLNLSKSQA